MSGLLISSCSEMNDVDVDIELADTLELDTGNLLAYDPAPHAHNPKSSKDVDEYVLKHGRTLVQALVSDLFIRPTVPDAAPNGRVVRLPDPEERLPRTKPLPKPKQKTRWEKFAEEKGIRSRKRSKLVFDEQMGEWRRRHGYGRVNDANDIAIIEHSEKDGLEAGADPFNALVKERKQRSKDNARKQERNVLLSRGSGGAGGSAAASALVGAGASVGLPSLDGGLKRGTKRDRGNLAQTAALVQRATAGLGKHGATSEGGALRLEGKRQRRIDATDLSADRQANRATVGRILRERSDVLVDSDKAAGKMENERRQAKAYERKAFERRKEKRTPPKKKKKG